MVVSFRYIDHRKMKEIRLTTGEVTMVDDEDFDELNAYKWEVGARGYATRRKQINKKRTVFLMHRIIMNTPVGMDTDHKDHNKLNNQKNNLRICTSGQNKMNRKKTNKVTHSRFKGVTIKRVENNTYYYTTVNHNGKVVAKKHFPFTQEGEVMAAKFYNLQAEKYFGEFVIFNNVGV